jgi:hypothetical protein
LEFDQFDELAPYAALNGDAGGLVSKEDIAHAGAGLQGNSSAALIVWEDTWRRSWPVRSATPTGSSSEVLEFPTRSLSRRSLSWPRPAPTRSRTRKSISRDSTSDRQNYGSHRGDRGYGDGGERPGRPAPARTIRRGNQQPRRAYLCNGPARDCCATGNSSQP